MLKDRRRLLAAVALATGAPGLLAAGRQSTACAAIIRVTPGVEGRAILPNNSWLGAKSADAVTVTGGTQTDRGIEVILQLRHPEAAPPDTPSPTEIALVRLLVTKVVDPAGQDMTPNKAELQIGRQRFAMQLRPFAGTTFAYELDGVPDAAAKRRLAQAVRRGGRMSLTALGEVVRFQARWTTPDLQPTIAAIDAKLLQLKQDRIAQRCTVSGGSGGAGCFLTTAAVDTLGLADDCWELRTLRAFRDGPLLLQRGGGAVVEAYYALAPRLVEAIGQRSDAARVWLSAYWTGVLPSAIAARLGLTQLALALYTRMTRRLERLAAL